MEDRGQDHLQSDNQRSANHEPVRSRWTPKPEQILILESIFNSGMVNPPKDETVRIRKLLEKFGAVGDANVFYWFQNRRSRSRRRQRQMQATLAAATTTTTNTTSSLNSSSQLIMHSGAMIHAGGGGGGSSSCTGSGGGGYAPPLLSSDSGSSYPNHHHHHHHHHQSLNDYHVMMAGSSPSSSASFYGGGGGLGIGGHEVAADNFFPVPTTQMGGGCQSDTSSMNYTSGYITVFINGVATEVPRGPIDMKAVFGENAMLVHSSGVPVPVNDFGFLMQILEHGESYFLVSRPT